jgi:muconolactone delta-isomerase
MNDACGLPPENPSTGRTEDKMRFLVLFRENPEVSSQIPPPALVEMVEGTGEYLDGLRASGKAQDAGFFAVDHGGYAIFNVESNTELFALVEKVPARGFCSVEAHPLLKIDEWRPVFAEAKTQMLEAFERMAAASPGG